MIDYCHKCRGTDLLTLHTKTGLRWRCLTCGMEWGRARTLNEVAE